MSQLLGGASQRHTGLLSTKITVSLSVMEWCLPMGWVSSWAGYCLVISLDSVPSSRTCISCRQDTFWVKSFVGGLVSLLLHWSSCLATGGDNNNIIPIDSWDPHLSLVSAMTLRYPTSLPHPPVEISIYSHDHLATSSVFPPPDLETDPSSHLFTSPTQFPPNICLL